LASYFKNHYQYPMITQAVFLFQDNGSVISGD